jgi:branched-chain amino acid aminotransferase
MENIIYQLKESKKEVILPSQLGFGQYFTDHMFVMDYDPKSGWHNPVIKSVENLPMHPSTMFMHYGQAVFEGLKAYKTVKGDIVIFRPEDHFQRFNNSCKRLCIPEISVPDVIDALKKLILVDENWVPKKVGEALYIRPFAFGTDPVLGVKASTGYKFIIVLSPVGAYYAEGFKPVKILAQDDYVRAVRKGLGECKTPANYAASLLATEDAKKKGFSQVLWIDGVEQKYIEEVGTMNIFISYKDEVVTPKLTGGFLSGITRKTVIQLLKDWNVPITERLISIDEVVSEYKKGNVTGIFGTGTAATISSVGWLTYKGFDMTINDGKPSDIAVRLFDAIAGLHYGRSEDKHKWLTYVKKVQEK